MLLIVAPDRSPTGFTHLSALAEPCTVSNRLPSRKRGSPRPPSRGPASVLAASSAVDPVLQPLRRHREPWLDPGSGAGVTKGVRSPEWPDWQARRIQGQMRCVHAVGPRAGAQYDRSNPAGTLSAWTPDLRFAPSGVTQRENRAAFFMSRNPEPLVLVPQPRLAAGGPHAPCVTPAGTERSGVQSRGLHAALLLWREAPDRGPPPSRGQAGATKRERSACILGSYLCW